MFLFKPYQYQLNFRNSYNNSFIFINRLTQKKWVGKIYFEIRVGIRDLDYRSWLAFRLGQLLHEPIPKMKLVQLDSVNWEGEGAEFITNLRQHRDVFINSNHCLASEYQGVPLTEFIHTHGWEKIRNLNAVIQNFIFNLWIGNYDKKDDDYVVNYRGECYSVDYDLFGPCFRFNSDVSLGVNAFTYQIDDSSNTGLCLGKLLIDHTRHEPQRYNAQFFQRRIRVIQKLKESTVARTIKGLSFQWQMEDGQITKMNNEEMLRFLLKRRDKLEYAVNEWLAAGMPRRGKMKGSYF